MQPYRADMQTNQKRTLFNNRGLVRMNGNKQFLLGYFLGIATASYLREKGVSPSLEEMRQLKKQLETILNVKD